MSMCTSNQGAFNNSCRFGRERRIAALILAIGAAITSEATPPTFWASYDGTYRPGLEYPPVGQTDWSRGASALSVDLVTIPGAKEVHAGVFDDNSAAGRIQMNVPVAGGFGADPAAVPYKYGITIRFDAEGASMAPAMSTLAMALAGFRDEDGTKGFGKTVLLGFFLDVDRRSPGNQPGVGFADENGHLVRLLKQGNYLDGRFHSYEVRKSVEAGAAYVAVLIDGAPVGSRISYRELPDATRNSDGFGYFTATPATVKALITDLHVGTAPIPPSVEVMPDWRDIRTGRVIWSRGYADQPYVVVNRDQSLTCVITTGDGVEAGPGQHVIAIRSRDGGATWSAPSRVEPPGAPENSWGVPVLAKSGRIYVLYTYNDANIRSLLDFKGRPFGRLDSLGHFVFRYSDDEGATWSANRYVIPMRAVQSDFDNVYHGDLNHDGKVDESDSKFFWTPAAAFSDGRSVFVGLSKIGNFDPSISFRDTEGWVICSPNILTAKSADEVTWSMLPEGRFGLRSREGTICEETSALRLTDGRLVAVCRTTDGVILMFYSTNDGRSWASPEPLCYQLDSRPLKNPRAKPCVWAIGSGRYLVWFENNGARGFDNRNPAWLALATEEHGRLECSQPEIFLYDRNAATRISYPDLYSVAGNWYVTETQKQTARVHAMPKAFLQQLETQGAAHEVTHEGLMSKWSDGDSHDWGLRTRPDIREQGLTLELWLKPSWRNRDEVLFATGARTARRMTVSTRERRVEFELSDGRASAVTRSDFGELYPGKWNHVVFIVEPGPHIMLSVVNGRLSDGGNDAEAGWTRYPDSLWSADETDGAVATARIGSDVGYARYYRRPLSVSEAISNYRAGFHN